MATEMLYMLGGLLATAFLILTFVHMECHRRGRRHSTKPLFHGLVLLALGVVAVLATVLLS